MLFSVIIQNPASATVQDDLRIIGEFVGFLRRLGEDGFDVRRLLTACIKLHDVAACAVSISQAEERSQSTGETSGQNHTLAQLDVSNIDFISPDLDKTMLTISIQSIRAKLFGVQDWLQLGQGFLSNLPMLRAEAEERLSDIYGIELSHGMYGLFVPELVKSQLY